MILGIDLRCLPADGSAGGGIAHAARALTRELAYLLRDRAVLYVPHGALHRPVQGGASVERTATTIELSDVRSASLVQGLKKYPCDVLFVPSGAVSPGLPIPAVPWVHDCDIFEHPEWFPQSWWKRRITTRLFLEGIRKAPHVFAVSEYTKCAVEKLVPSAKGHVTVTGEGGDAELASVTSDQMQEVKDAAVSHLVSRGITRRFALILGTLEPRKNIPLICRVWPEVIKAIPGIDLVIAGQDGWKTEPIVRAIEECRKKIASSSARVIRLSDFSEDERRDLLHAASLVLVPSFSEGFSLVALEAIQAGTPVLASNRGALPEVVGEGPPSLKLRGGAEWLLDPVDENAWRDQIVRTLGDAGVRNQIIVGQSLRRDMFSWKQSAEIILNKITS